MSEPALILEMCVNGRWSEMGRHVPGTPPGTFSNNASGNREIIEFECLGSRSEITRSLGGVDTEVAGGLGRLLSTSGFERLAELFHGEVYEMQLQTDRMTQAIPVRFRHEEGK